jgi:hypothetical protein
MDEPIWLITEEVCRRLVISRSTLFQLRRQGLQRDGRHVVPKNPGCPRSDLLWHQGRCSALLTLARARRWCFAHGVIRADELQQVYGPPLNGTTTRALEASSGDGLTASEPSPLL